MSEITEAMLAEWERLANEATPEPWHVTKDGEQVIQTKHVTRDVWIIPHHNGDLPFVAAARTALPLLVAEVRRLRSSVPGTTPRDCRACDAAPPECEKCRASPGTTETGTREALIEAAERIEQSAPACRASSLRPEETDAARDAFVARLRALAALPVSRGEASLVPYFLADGSEVLLPREEVERRRRAAAKVIDCARSVILDLDTYRDVKYPTARALSEALDNLGPDASPSPGSETPRGAEVLCACHDDGPPDGRGRCQTCLLPRRPAPASPPSQENASTWPCAVCGKPIPIGPGAMHLNCAFANPAPSPSLPGDNHAEEEE